MHTHSSGPMGPVTLTRHALCTACSPPVTGRPKVTPKDRRAGPLESSGDNENTSAGSGEGVPLLPAAGCVRNCAVQAC